MSFVVGSFLSGLRKISQKYILSLIALSEEKMYNTCSLEQEVEEIVRQGAVMSVTSNRGGGCSHCQAWTHRLWPITRRFLCLVVRDVFADAVYRCARLGGCGQAVLRLQATRGESRQADTGVPIPAFGRLAAIWGEIEVCLLQYTWGESVR